MPQSGISSIVINRIFTVYHQIHHHIGWKTRVTCRAAEGLAFVLDGSATYTFQDREVAVSKNEILYLKKSESYTSCSSDMSSRPYTIILVNFSYDESNSMDKLPLPTRISINSNNAVAEKFDELLNIWNSNSPFAYTKSLSLLYDIIYSLLLSTIDIDMHHKNRQKIMVAINYINQCYSEKIKLYELAHLAHLSIPHLIRSFSQAFNMSPIEYLINIRIKHAKRLLRDKSAFTISEVAYKTGFSSSTYFCRVFKRHEGICPSLYQKVATSDHVDMPDSLA